MENEKNSNRLVIDDTVYSTQLTRKFRQRKAYVKPNPKLLHAFIPGKIKEVYVKQGQHVKEGDKLLILEAMKMKNTVRAHINGVIKSIPVELGDMVYKGQVLIEFE
jgi:biotin carboxyl carrier protein